MDLSGVRAVAWREMTALARGPRLRRGWALFPTGLAFFVGVNLTMRLRLGDGVAAASEVAPAMRRAFVTLAAVHMAVALMALPLAAHAVAVERERRTLDFLLTTRLRNAEVVLGKLAGVLAVQVSMVAAGLPLMILMTALSGTDPLLLGLTYAATAGTTLMSASIGLAASAVSRDRKAAMRRAAIGQAAWLILPLLITQILPRIGVPIPGPLKGIAAVLLATGPMGLLLKIVPGPPGRSALIDAVGKMVGLEVLCAVALLILAIFTLRKAVKAEGAGPAKRAAWRPRSRPEVGDDPILWRERHTGRPRGWNAAPQMVVNVLIGGLLLAGMAYFAPRALAEVWAHGYNAGPSDSGAPEMNLITRFFVPGLSGGAADQARLDLNLFVRVASLLLGFSAIAALGFAVESIALERARETWRSLLTTPLSGEEILRSKRRAVFFRVRPVFLATAALWGVGLIAGALHPIGVIVAVPVTAAWFWLFVMVGLYGALQAKSSDPSDFPAIGLVSLLIFTGLLPFALADAYRSVFLGAGSLPFDLWLSLVSWRDVRVAARGGAYAPLAWMGLHTGEGVGAVAAAITLGIVGPWLLSRYAWRRAVQRFDRLVGRPLRPLAPLPAPADSTRAPECRRIQA